MKIYDFEELLDHWRELEAGGIPLEPMQYRAAIDRRNSGRGLVIEQHGELASNTIFEIENNSVGYILDPFILCDLPGKTIIMHWELEIPWEESLFHCLPDPTEDGPKDALYSFPGKRPLQYPREMILNHRMCGKCVLRRGDILQGMLLGVGYAPIPKTYKHGAEIQIILKIIDQWGWTHSAPFRIWLDQSVTLERQIQKRGMRAKLFCEADPNISS